MDLLTIKLKHFNLELLVYSFSWILAVCYSMYRLHLAGLKYAYALGEDLKPGYLFLNRRKDVADYEWQLFSSILLSWAPFVLGHLALTRLTAFSKTLTFTAHVGISAAWIISTLGIFPCLFLLIQPVLIWLVFCMTNIKVIWAVIIAVIFSLETSYTSPIKYYLAGYDDDKFEKIVILLTWTYARCISFCSDTRDDHLRTGQGITRILHYTMYLPLLPSGPLLPYKEFQQHKHEYSSSRHRFVRNLLNVFRYVFWKFFHDFCVHFFYHSALQYRPELVRRFNNWTLAGLGYCLGQFFMIKYTVMYGLPSAISKLDGMQVLPAPKCIGRVHLYSQMWRDFDRGLYLFMLRYIYIPCLGKRKGLTSKLCASGLCFLFVCVWHNASQAVIVWCLLNYLGLCVESIGKHLLNSPPFKNIRTSLSMENARRIEAILCSPLLLMSALSNFYFFSSYEVGNIFMHRVFVEGSFSAWLCILGSLYCCCHVSMAVSRWENRHRPQEKSTERNCI